MAWLKIVNNMVVWAEAMQKGETAKRALDTKVMLSNENKKEILATKYVHPDVEKQLNKYQKKTAGKMRMGYRPDGIS